MIDGRFRFDNFVVGAANRLAVSAVRAVADTPGVVYNPLFIYSSSGLGKTHLLGALGVQVRHLHPDLAVEYATLDDFVDQLHSAIASASRGLQASLSEHRRLLLDDVQFSPASLRPKVKCCGTQRAAASGRQVVMTSDRPPSDIADVDERLLTRLSADLSSTSARRLRNARCNPAHKCQERGATFPTRVLKNWRAAARRTCASCRARSTVS